MSKLLSLLIFSTTCYANEAECLAHIFAAEDDRSIQGVMQLANASINRAANQKRNVCSITGVKRKHPKPHDKPYLLALARAALASPRLNDADSWDIGRKPHLPGLIRAYAGGQTFYKLKS